MNSLPSYLDLRGEKPLFTGGSRLIFRCPQRADILIKVPKDRAAKGLRAALSPLNRYNLSNLREIEEFARLYQKGALAPGETPRHLFALLGVIRTNYGLSLAVKAEYGRGGGFAKTLKEIAAAEPEGMAAPRLKAPLAAFRAYLCATPLRFYDLWSKNVVLAVRGGGEECVIIDGIGVYRHKILYSHLLAKYQKLPPWLKTR